MRRASKIRFVKTSISLPKFLWDFAIVEAEREGFPSVSAYLCQLMRSEWKQAGGVASQLNEPAPIYAVKRKGIDHAKQP